MEERCAGFPPNHQTPNHRQAQECEDGDQCNELKDGAEDGKDADSDGCGQPCHEENGLDCSTLPQCSTDILFWEGQSDDVQFDQPAECECAVSSRVLLDPHISCCCDATDDVYGINYCCSRPASEAFTYDNVEKLYCSVHSSLFIDHRKCLFCDVFCIQDDACFFEMCSAQGKDHWTHKWCRKNSAGKCSHCGSSADVFRRRQLHLPEHDELMQMLSSVSFQYNTGQQLNLLSLCDERFRRLLLSELRNVIDSKSAVTEDLVKIVQRADFRSLLGKIWRSPPESVEELEDAIAAVKEAIIRNDELSVLIILQFVDVNVGTSGLRLAIEAASPLITKILLHTRAYETAMGECESMSSLLSYSLRRGSFTVAEEILKFLRRGRIFAITNDIHFLEEAIHNEKALAMELLVRYGANLFAVNESGETVLHLLAKCDDERAVKAATVLFDSTFIHSELLEKEDIEGRTALQVACNHSNWLFAKQLLDCGASPLVLPNGMKAPEPLRNLISYLTKEFRYRKRALLKRNLITQDISMGGERFAIPVENGTADGAVLDPNFQYANTVVEIDDFGSKIDFSLACHCIDNCEFECPCTSRCAYDNEGRLTPEAITLAVTGDLGIVLECNSSCFCTNRCRSRVAQAGIRTKLEIYRSISYGWAVRCTAPIAKGEFICEYTGELISDDDADERSDDTYLFEIIDCDSPYCIDAKRRGNVSRFVNHSCDANLVVVRVAWDPNVRHFPHICFFARRDINKGEELTIDYGKQWWDVKLREFLCECGSKICRYREAAREKLLTELAQLEKT